MTKNYTPKKRSSQRKKTSHKPRTNRRQSKKSNRAPAWAWIVIGLLLAGLISLLFFLSDSSDGPQASPKAQPNPAKTTKVSPPQPRFDFYEILKEREITVPDRSAEITASIPKDIEYFLQAASFRRDQEADKLRVELLLSNMEAKIESSSKNGQTWHRVIAGPFKTRSKMAKARSILASRGLSPLLLKRKKE
jgi:cell division protein FtsN